MSTEANAVIERDEFTQMDSYDEEQIVAELSEETQTTWVYQFVNGEGKQVTGLSWVGVKEVAYRMDERVQPSDKFQLEHVHTEFTPDTVICMVRATFQGRSRLGAAEAQRTMKKKDGTSKYDPFAVPKALNKAQRNAMSALFSAEIVNEVKRIALSSPQQRVKVVQAPALPAPDPREEARKRITWLASVLNVTEEEVEHLKQAGGVQTRDQLARLLIGEYGARATEPAPKYAA